MEGSGYEGYDRYGPYDFYPDYPYNPSGTAAMGTSYLRLGYTGSPSRSGADVQMECNSGNSTARLSFSGGNLVYKYEVKVIDQARKSNYTVKKLRAAHRFTTFDDLRGEISNLPGITVGDVGYIEPGHGLRGKQRWLETDEDLEEMYTVHKSKCTVLLWCYNGDAASDKSNSRKRSRSACGDQGKSEGGGSSTKRNACSDKLDEVEAIVKKLQDEHGETYSVEKLNCWAHLIHLGKHTSYSTPPDLPYFKKRHSKEPERSGESQDKGHGKSTCSTTGASPTKRLGFRSECIDQLSKWHSLLEKGAISDQQYQELKKTILGDISQF